MDSGPPVPAVPPPAAPQPYPPQPYPSQPYAPQPGYPAQPYAPQPYAPQPYAPQPYAPQPYAPQPGYPAQPYAPQPYAPQSGYPSPAYPEGEPYPLPMPPPPLPNAILDPDLHYRQRLGAYQRPQPQAVATGPARASYVRVLPRTRRWHDGFYFRFGLGVGSAHDSMESDGSLPSARDLGFTPGPLEGSGGGLGPVTEVAVGYSIHGLVLGAGVFTATVTSFDARTDDPDTGNYRFKLTQFALMGPVLDYYFDRAGGLHVQGSAGLATVVAGAAKAERDGPLAQAHTALGLGFMLGVGYEWWADDQWSLGLIGRFTYSSTTGEDNRGVTWSHSSYAPALLLGATYH